MRITQRVAGDIDTLVRRARRARDAEQKDRYLVAAHACRGREAADIQAMLARSRGFVQRWAYAYRDGGIDALTDKPRGGSVAKIRGPAAAHLRVVSQFESLPTFR